MLEPPIWTVTINPAVGEPYSVEVEGFPEFRTEWLVLLRKNTDGSKHVVAAYPARNVLSISSHTYVSEENR